MAIQPDILVALADLHKQATTERSHYYTASVITAAIKEIVELRNRVRELDEGRQTGSGRQQQRK
jgi:hypothetical protein